MGTSSAFAELVKEKAETLRAMVEAGLLTEREVELLELAGLDLDKKGRERALKATPKPKKIRKPPGTPKARRTLIMLSKPVKTVQDRLRF